MEEAVRVVLMMLGIYLGLGILLLPPLHRIALPAIDDSARGASWGFKMLVSPGVVALWPVILWKWNTASRGGNPHGRPDAPVSSRGIRRAQSLLVKLVAVAVPLLAAAVLIAG